MWKLLLSTEKEVWWEKLFPAHKAVVIISYFYRALNAQGADNIWSGAKQIKFCSKAGRGHIQTQSNTKPTTQNKHGIAQGHCKGRAIEGGVVLGWRKEGIPLKYNKIIENLWIGAKASKWVVQANIFFKKAFSLHFLSRKIRSLYYSAIKKKKKERKRKNVIWSNLDGLKDHPSNWSKSGRERQIPYRITHMWTLWNKWTYLWNRSRLTDMRIDMVAKRRGRGKEGHVGSLGCAEANS